MSGGEKTVYLGLGSNLGDRQANLSAALAQIEPDIRVKAVSSLYETDPVGPQGQSAYYNAACRAVTYLAPRALLERVKAVEQALGRKAGPRWGPRLIDIDILLYGDESIGEEGLRIPHPELPKRAFVLAPLVEVAAGVVHPELRETIDRLAGAVDGAGVRLALGQGWEQASRP